MSSLEYSWDNPCSDAYQCFWSSSVPRELEFSSSSMESNHGPTDTPEKLFAPAMIDSWSDSDYTRVDEMLEEIIPSLDFIDTKIPTKNLLFSLNQEDNRLATDHPSVIAGATRPVIDSPEFGLSPVDPGMLSTFSEEGSNRDMCARICPPVNDVHFFSNYKPSSPPANDLHLFADPAKPKKLRHETISFRNSSNSPVSSSGEPDVEAIAQMKEMMYRAAALRPVNFDANDEAVVARPRRKNVRISSDPQTVAARQRRERISERIRVLQRLVPGGNKMDTASILEEAANYLKYLRSQVSAMEKKGKKVEVDVRSAMAAFNYDHTSQAAVQAARELPHDHPH